MQATVEGLQAFRMHLDVSFYKTKERIQCGASLFGNHGFNIGPTVPTSQSTGSQAIPPSRAQCPLRHQFFCSARRTRSSALPCLEYLGGPSLTKL